MKTFISDFLGVTNSKTHEMLSEILKESVPLSDANRPYQILSNGIILNSTIILLKHINDTQLTSSIFLCQKIPEFITPLQQHNYAINCIKKNHFNTSDIVALKDVFAITLDCKIKPTLENKRLKFFDTKRQCEIDWNDLYWKNVTKNTDDKGFATLTEKLTYVLQNPDCIILDSAKIYRGFDFLDSTPIDGNTLVEAISIPVVYTDDYVNIFEKNSQNIFTVLNECDTKVFTSVEDLYDFYIKNLKRESE